MYKTHPGTTFLKRSNKLTDKRKVPFTPHSGSVFVFFLFTKYRVDIMRKAALLTKSSYLCILNVSKIQFSYADSQNSFDWHVSHLCIPSPNCRSQGCKTHLLCLLRGNVLASCSVPLQGSERLVNIPQRQIICHWP